MQARRWILGWVALLTALVALGFFCHPAHAAGAPIWDAVSFGIGAQGRWLDAGGYPPDRQLEAAGNVALSLTPHVSITGGAAYGFSGSYVRGQADARLTATDVTDPNFNIWLGVGRYFSKRPSDGLDEMAGKAGVGWRPFGTHQGEYGPEPSPVVLGATAAYGLDTGRRSITVSLTYVLKAVHR